MAAMVAVALVVAAVIALADGSSAAQPPVVAAPHGKPSTIYAGPGGRAALSGLWRVTLDRGDTGRSRGYQRGYFGGALVRLPFVPKAQDIAEKKGIANFEGTVAWYRTRFQVLKPGRYAIRFESVNHRADVWIDGKRVGGHTGTYLPFDIRVDLDAGRRHTIVVRTDWRDPLEMKRQGWHRTWFNFGGINREVTIRPIGSSEILSPNLQTRLQGGKAVVSLSARVRNNATETRDVPLKGALVRDGERVELSFAPRSVGPGATASTTAQATIDDPALWSTGDPNLWELELEVPGESSYRARVGLREIRTVGRRMLLNGKPLRLRGASIQEDVLGRGDGLLPRDQDALVSGLKALNANATRSQHPVHPALLERLDAAGILLWQGIGPVDAPGNWTSDGPRKERQARERVRTTVRQEQLHPSILTWNLANEVAREGNDASQIDFIDGMARELHRRDPGRPVALDIWGSHPPVRNSRMYSAIDMIGWTNYIGWYEATYEPPSRVSYLIRTRLARLRRAFPSKVIAVTEFGAEANGRNATNSPGGYGFQAKLLGVHVDTYRSIPDLGGMLVWNLRDFAVSPRFGGGSIHRSVPDIRLVRGVNQKGLFTFGNRAKPAAKVIADRFAEIAGK